MAAKHTPGPWEADAEDMQQGADDIFTVSIWAPGPDGDRLLVGSVSAFSLMSETRSGAEFVTTDAPSIDKLEEAKANARLIAAAPNLAFQLLAAANYIDALGGDSRSYRQAYAAATGGAA